MKAFRADKRLFRIGDSITTAGEYAKMFDGAARSVEQKFDELRPAGMPSRSECLFLAEDVETAKLLWSRMTEGKLYEVEIDDAEVLHSGDMSLLEEAAQLATANAAYEHLARDYWAGARSQQPTIELLARSAVVTSVISTSTAERREYLKKRLKLVSDVNGE